MTRWDTSKEEANRAYAAAVPGADDRRAHAARLCGKFIRAFSLLDAPPTTHTAAPPAKEQIVAALATLAQRQVDLAQTSPLDGRADNPRCEWGRLHSDGSSCCLWALSCGI